MAPPSKIQNTDEAIRWILEGRTYFWMTEEHRRKYGILISPSGWSYFRRRHGFEPRLVRDDNLIPWGPRPEHKYHYLLYLLRVEARRRAGKPIDSANEGRLAALHRDLREKELVIHYDPDSAEGFLLVPAEPGDDDIIRRPTDRAAMRKRRAYVED